MGKDDGDKNYANWEDEDNKITHVIEFITSAGGLRRLPNGHIVVQEMHTMCGIEMPRETVITFQAFDIERVTCQGCLMQDGDHNVDMFSDIKAHLKQTANTPAVAWLINALNPIMGDRWRIDG